MQRDPRWERVSGGIVSDRFGRRISIDVRGAGGHRVGVAVVIPPEDEPYFGSAIDRMVRELDKALHA